MKRLAGFLILAFLFQSSFALADEDRGGKDRDRNREQGSQKKMNGGRKGNRPQQQHPQRQSKMANPRPAQGNNPSSHGNNGGVSNGQNRNVGQNFNRKSAGNGGRGSQNQGQNYRAPKVSAQFRKMGIHSYPHPLARNQMLTTDRTHSSITYPTTGAGGASLHAKVFARASISSPVVRTHMATVMSADFHSQIVGLNVSETRANNYYWHSYNGFNYCHYYDPWGYHWYGWYLGGNCFWTRYYSNNWWWYDPVYYRWCYWHDGGWWWQDPYHVNTVYVYVNGNYQASPSSGDVNTTVVPDANLSASSAKVYRSSDSSRMVKVTGSSEDAFLYDTTDNPSFQPIYLASGVKEVRLSNTQNGRALQVMLILNDGSFDLFDDQGNPFNGSNGGDNGNGGGQAAPMDNSSNQPPAGAGNSAPPSNPGNPPAPNGPMNH